MQPLPEFLYNNVRVKYVDTRDGIALYVSSAGHYGVRVYPDGRKVLVNPRVIKKRGDGTKQEYLVFDVAFGHHKPILVSHAVHIAWIGPIQPGMTIDHIDGCTTNNDFRNLRQIDLRTNMRDGGFLRKLRNKGINSLTIDRPYLLRYFERMAKLKAVLSKWHYLKLTKEQLLKVLYDSEFHYSLIINH